MTGRSTVILEEGNITGSFIKVYCKKQRIGGRESQVNEERGGEGKKHDQIIYQNKSVRKQSTWHTPRGKTRVNNKDVGG